MNWQIFSYNISCNRPGCSPKLSNLPISINKTVEFDTFILLVYASNAPEASILFVNYVNKLGGCGGHIAGDSEGDRREDNRPHGKDQRARRSGREGGM